MEGKSVPRQPYFAGGTGAAGAPAGGIAGIPAGGPPSCPFSGPGMEEAGAPPRMMLLTEPPPEK